MAQQTTFNIDEPGKDADYTDKSKGMIPDLGTASLFESVATVGSEAIKGINELFKTKIRDDATQGVDEIRDREINMGAQQKGYGTQVPQEINNAANRLQTMKNAKESGQIGDSHYFLLLDSEARRLRSRYPGHREYVDNVMQDLTGVNPANHAIGLMKAELNKENKNSDLLNEYHWSREHGGPVADALAANQRPDLETARSLNAKHGAILAQRKAFDSALSTSEKQRTANYHKVEDQTNQEIFGAQGLRDEAGMKIQGVDTQALAKAATGFREALDKGIAEPEARKALNMELVKYKEDSLKKFNAQLDEVRYDKDKNPFTLRSLNSNEAMERITSRFNKDIETRTKAYREGNIDYMSMDADTVKASENTAILKLVREAPYMARVDAHRKLGGDQLTSLMLGESSAFLTAEHRLFQRYIIQGISTDSKETVDTTTKQAELRMKEAGIPPEDIANIKRMSIKNISDALASGKMTPDQTKATATWLFSGDPQNKDFYAKAGSYQDPLFRQLVQPRITEAIMNSNDQTIKDSYTKFVDTAVYNRMIGNQNVAGFTQIAQLAQSPSMYGIKYNPEVKQFEPTVLQGKTASDDRTVQTSNQGFHMAAAKIANDLNTTMRHYTPVADKLGRDPNQNVQNMLTMHGLQMGTDGEIIAAPKPGAPKPVNTAPEAPVTAPSTINKNSAISPAAPSAPASVKADKESAGDQTVPNFAAGWNPTTTLNSEDIRANPTQENLKAMRTQPLTAEELRKAQEDQAAGRPLAPRVRDAIDIMKRNLQKKP